MALQRQRLAVELLHLSDRQLRYAKIRVPSWKEIRVSICKLINLPTWCVSAHVAHMEIIFSAQSRRPRPMQSNLPAAAKQLSASQARCRTFGLVDERATRLMRCVSSRFPRARPTFKV